METPEKETELYPTEVYKKVRLEVWADGTPGKAKNTRPIQIPLKRDAGTPNLKQYPLKQKAQKGIQPILEKFLKIGLIRPCRSPYTTFIFPVKKPNSAEYRFVQDLRAINEVVQDLHPVLPNPYTLLTTILGEYGWFSVLDLKDAFFCILIVEESQQLFAVEWQDPETQVVQQYCWTVLPQGVKNSSTLFGETLSRDLRDLILDEGLLLQYVDDLHIVSPTYDKCLQNTIRTLNYLANCGYKVSQKKAQICKQQVTYLGFVLSQGQQDLLPDRKQEIAGLGAPKTQRQLRGFLGMAGFCRIWIPSNGLIVKPLYEALKRHDLEPLTWTKECQTTFETIKTMLVSALALGQPDLKKLFKLYVHERQGISFGVLIQTLRNIPRPVTYFSKQLEETVKGWPPGLQAVAATCDRIQEAEKLTLEQPTTVYVPHHVLSLLEQKGAYWLTFGRMGKYQAILLDNPNVRLQVTSALNPATLLLIDVAQSPEHDCLHVIELVYSSRPDLMDLPLAEPDMELFTDGSSFIDKGRRPDRYITTCRVVTLKSLVEAKALPPGSSAQKAEIIALTRALLLAKGKRVNIYRLPLCIFCGACSGGDLERKEASHFKQ